MILNLKLCALVPLCEKLLAPSLRSLMDKQLLPLLQCPLTQRELRLVSREELARINAHLKEQPVFNRGGTQVDPELDGCLVCEPDGLCYPIRQGLPYLLRDEAFSLAPSVY